MTSSKIAELRRLYEEWKVSDHQQIVSYEYQFLCGAAVQALPELLDELTAARRVVEAAAECVKGSLLYRIHGGVALTASLVAYRKEVGG